MGDLCKKHKPSILVTKKEAYYLAMLKDYEGWHIRYPDRIFEKDYAYYRDSEVHFDIASSYPNPMIIDGSRTNESGGRKYIHGGSCMRPDPFSTHGHEIIKRILSKDPSRKKWRRKTHKERAQEKTAHVIERVLKANYTWDEIQKLMEVTNGVSFRDLPLKDFTRFLTLHSDYKIRDFKALIVTIDMVPLLMEDRWQIMDFVSWRLQIGK